MVFSAVIIRIECNQNNNNNNEKLSSRDIVKLVLVDPEFLAMNDYDKLRVLEALHTVFENHLWQHVIEYHPTEYSNSLNELRWKKSLENNQS